MGHFIDQGKPRTAEVLQARAQSKDQLMRLACKRCEAHLITWRVHAINAQPRTFEMLVRQAQRTHDQVCPGTPPAAERA